MSEHQATIRWRLEGDDFSYEGYNREHEWHVDGTTLSASAAPQFRGRPGHLDPESALVAALSSCHMLTFLALCARSGHTVSAYADEAVGVLEKNDEGRLAVTRVTLRPWIRFRGTPPDSDARHRLHQLAHERCFIANSVTTDVAVEERSVEEEP